MIAEASTSGPPDRSAGYKPLELRLTTSIGVPMTAADAQAARQKARSLGMPVSAWIRSLITKSLSSVGQ